jgi:hypothetical protein
MCTARLAGETEGKYSEGGWKTETRFLETHYKPKYLIDSLKREREREREYSPAYKGVTST